ncbi:BTAD domain-containing putative transcriptional regulator [Dactylosporangium sp. NPDC000555]|uniref:BTAD domain-containing putative transcriptional regulator n=1 Tax=Dactylosporangium sp. NPDC000555 TaxID=3154260 RepID=UPI00331A1E55
MQFRVLGPMELVGGDGQIVDLGGPKLRAVLSLLLLDANRVVPLDRLIDQLWGDEPPASATGNLQSYISQLRRILEPSRGPRQPAERLLTRPPGYLIRACEDDLDLLRFSRLIADGGKTLHDGDPQAAEALLREGLALWRGEPLADLVDEPAIAAERMRLQELYLTARERYGETLLALGRAETAVVLLDRLVVEQPLRERLWVRLATALYQAGRQADALDAVRRCAAMLRSELGLEPGPELREVEQAVLRQDLALSPSRPAAPAVAVITGTSPGLSSPAEPAQEAPSPEVPGTGLVGRRGERARLRTALSDAVNGRGSVLVLEGEAGIGKTRLAEEAAEMALAQGWRVAWGRCADDTGAPALWPWLQILRQLERSGEVEPAGLLPDPAGDPDRQRFALFEQLRTRLAQAAAAQPVMLVLDDVQAADVISLHLLVLLARHLDDVRLVTVATARTIGEDLPRTTTDELAALARERRTTRIVLSGLGEGDVRQLLAGLGALDGHQLASEIHARTEGNPFFVVELARLLSSEQSRVSSARQIPPSVRDVLDRRLARLPDDTRSLLALAAVIGRDFPLDLIQAAASLDAERVITVLEPAVISQVISEDDDRWVWRFSHALVQETLIAGLSRVQRARLHRQAGLALETRGRAGRLDVERLAHHFFQAVPVTGAEPAIGYAIDAASAARDRLAHDEAAAHTRRALALLDATDDDGARRRHELLVALGNDLLRSGHPHLTQEVIAEAIDIARRLGDRARLAAAASVWGGVTLWNWRSYGMVDESLVALLEDLAAEVEDDPRLRAELLGTLGVELAYHPVRRDDGIRYADQGVALARQLRDPALLGRTLNNYGLVAWGSSDGVRRRLAAADEALALAGHGLPARTEFLARLHRGPLRLHLGDAPGFETDLAAAARLADGLTGPEVRPHLLFQQTGLAMLRGEWDRAEELSTEACELYRATSLWGAQCCYALHQFTFRRRDRRLADVLDLLVDTADLQIPLVQTIAILAAAEIGDTAEAARLVRRWAPAEPSDWTTDALAAARAELTLALDGDLDAAYQSLLPYESRQIVVGTATACWGSYDALLARVARHAGRDQLAARHQQAAVDVGRRIGSPWQADPATHPMR